MTESIESVRSCCRKLGMEAAGGRWENGGVWGGGGVVVMTDEQMEMLRKQIAVYASLCDKLLHLHKSISSQHDLPGMRLENSYYNNPILRSGIPQSIPSRQRWAPKAKQLQMLELMFNQSNATPSRDRIKEIAAELAEHGPISETNVYNWFQNRRARSKRKQSAMAATNSEAQLSTEILESFQEKNKTIPEDNNNNSPADDTGSPLLVDHFYFQSPEIGMDQLMGKLEFPLSFEPYLQVEQHGLFE